MAQTDFPDRSPASAAPPDAVQAVVEVGRGQTVVAQGIKSEAFVLHAPRADVANFAREGNSLIVEFKDGTQLRIDNFFVRNNQLVLVDAEQPYQVDFWNALGKPGGDGIADELVQFQPVPIPTAAAADVSTQALLALLGFGAGVAILAHDKGDSGPGGETPPTPPAPTSYADNTSLFSSPVSTQPVTNEIRPGINIGALPDGQSASLYVDGHKVISLYDPQAGTLKPMAALPDGVHDITYTVSANGKESAPSGAITITIITTPPATPAAPTSYADDAAAVPNDHSTASTTADSTPGLNIGALPDGQSASLYVDGRKVDAHYDAQAGTLTPDSPLPDGRHVLAYTLSDALGNESHLSGALTLTIDSVPAPTISIIMPIASDDVIDATEATALIISGRTSGVEAGQSVTVTFTDSAGKQGSVTLAQVGSDGNWGTSAFDLSAFGFKDGDLTVSASVADKAGHAAQDIRHASLDTTPLPGAPGISIDVIAGNDVVNAQEIAAGVTISGKTVNVEDGQTVSVHLQDSSLVGFPTWTTQVKGGVWSIDVPSSFFPSLFDGDITVTVSVADKAGATAGNIHHFTLDSTPATDSQISIDTIAGDNVINAQEAGALSISGSAVHVEPGQLINVTIADGAGNHTSATAQVGSDGHWSTAAVDLSGLKDGDLTVTAVIDATGTQATRHASLDTTAPDAPSLMATDNAGSQTGPINGGDTTDDARPALGGNGESGATISIYDGTAKLGETQVDGNGHWQFTLPTALADGMHSLTATATDPAGNTGPASAALAFTVDTTPATDTQISIDTIAGDNVINAQEAGALGISGSAAHVEPGQLVNVTIADGAGNHASATAQVGSDGHWSTPAVDLSGLKDGDLTVTAVIDATGTQATRHAILDTLASISIDTPIAGSGAIDATQNTALVITGKSEGVEDGQIVSVTFSDGVTEVHAVAQIKADGTWTAAAADLGSLRDGQLTITASVSDKAGNPAQDSQHASLDSTPIVDLPTIGIDPITGNDVIDANESRNLTLSGSTTYVEDGQQVSITISDGTTDVKASATVSHGLWSVDAIDISGLNYGNITVTAEVENAAGVLAHHSRDAFHDTTPVIGIDIDPITSDNVVNASESSNLSISGTAANVAGKTVDITISDDFNHEVHASATVDSNGIWRVDGVDISSLQDGGLGVFAIVGDDHGNTTYHVVYAGLHTTAPDAPSLEATDNAGAQTGPINGGDTTDDARPVLGGNGAIGATIGIYDGTAKLGETQVDGNGHWQFTLPTALADGLHSLTATATDYAGNTGPASAALVFTVDASALPASISIGTIAGDDIINAQEAGAAVAISGLASHVADAATVTVTISDGTTNITLSAQVSGNAWSVNLSAAGIATLSDGQITVSAAVAGTTLQDSKHIILDTHAPAETVTIQSDSGGSLISGTLSGPLADGSQPGVTQETLQVSIDGGPWQGAAVTGTTWTFDNAANPLLDGSHTLAARIIDMAGNVSPTVSQEVTISGAGSQIIRLTSIDPDTGASNNDFITSDPGLTFSGTLAVALGSGQQVQISLDGGTNWKTVTDVNGTHWTFDNTGNAFAQGNYAVQMRVYDTGASQTVAASATQTVVVDQTAPGETPTITAVASSTGPVAGWTIDTNTPRFTGALSAPLADGSQPGVSQEVLQASIDGGPWQNVSTTGTGTTWVFDTTANPLTEGSHTLGVRIIDMAGNVGAQTASQTFTVGTLGQQAITIDSITPDTGLSASDFITNTGALVFYGTLANPLSAGEKAQISLDGGQTWSDATANGTHWTYDATSNPLQAWIVTVEARVIDGSGNQVGDVATQQLVLDGYSSSVLITIAPSNDSSIVSGTLSGPLADGSYPGGYPYSVEFLQVSLDGGQTWHNATVNGTHWTYDATGTAPGTHTVEARIMDTAGNAGSFMAVQPQFTIPAAAASPISIGSITPDTGASSSDFITSNPNLVFNGTLSGALASGQAAQISLDGGQTWHGVTVTGTHWTYDNQANALPDGAYTVEARVIDGSGQQVGDLATQQVVVDTTVPVGTSNGVESNNDGAVLSWSVDVPGGGGLATGTQPGVSAEWLQFSLDGGSTWQDITQVVVDNYGNHRWIASLSDPLSQGGHPVEMRIVDLAGNASTPVLYHAAAGKPLETVTVTAVTPGAHVPDGAAANGTDGYFVTNSGALTFSGTLSVPLAGDGEEIVIEWAGDSGFGYVYSVNGTNWTQDFSANPLSQGTYDVQAYVYNWGESQGGAVTHQTLVVDLTAPGETVTSIAASSDGKTLSGTLDSALADGSQSGVSAEQVQISLDGGTTWTAASVNGTNWSYDASANPLSNGSHSIEARVVDLAGNAGQTVTQDIVINRDMTTSITIDTPIAGDNVINAQEAASLAISGHTANVADGQIVSVTISDDAGHSTAASAAVNGGHWSASGFDMSGLSDGGITVGASVSPQAGAAPVQGAWDAVLDTTANIEITNQSALQTILVNDAIVIQGRVTGVEDGQDVTVQITHESTHTVFSFDAPVTGGLWEIDTPPLGTIAGASLSDSPLSIVASVSDKAGNLASQSEVSFLVTGPTEMDPLPMDGTAVESTSSNDIATQGASTDTLLTRALAAADASGGNGGDQVSGFTLGVYGQTPHASRIDLSQLLTGYSPLAADGPAHYVDGKASIDAGDTIGDYLKVKTENGNTVISIDRDGAATAFSEAPLLTLNGVETDLATLLANHQIVVSHG